MATRAPILPDFSGGGGGGGTDERVKVSNTDAGAGYLSVKIVAEANTPLVFNVLNGGAFETLEFDLDGDQLHIDWSPTNYIRNATPIEAGDVNDLTAHLKGIDDELGLLDSSDLNQRVRLENMFNAAYVNHYSEMSYTGDDLTQIDIWEDNTKILKLFTRTLSYSGDNLTTVTTTDEISSAVLTTTLTYSGIDLDTVTKVIT